MSEETETNIIFTLARMNPPTPGHLFLIQKLIEQAIIKNANKVYVILSNSNKDNENPIDCQEKLNVFGNKTNSEVSKTMIGELKKNMITQQNSLDEKNAINNIEVDVICVGEGENTFSPIVSIIKNKQHIDITMIIGEDRKELLDSFSKFLFTSFDNIYTFDGIALPREEMGEYKSISSDPKKLNKLVISDVPINSMSASFVRNIVKNGRKDIFIELYEKYLDYDKINHLYDIIYDGLQKPNKKIQSKSITTTYEPKYIYPITRETFINMEKNTKKTRKSYDLPKTKKMRKGGKKKQTKQTKRKK